MTDITLEQADSIVHGAIEQARAAGAPPISIVVLDRAGHVVSARRQDGASMFRFDVALGKAWTSAAFGVSSRKLAKKAAGNPNFFVSLASTAQGRLLPNPGGLPIRLPSGEVIGAVGISGDSGENDEKFAAAGIAGAGLETDT
jgi:uncharacterized protein GlcG (DUF336 family)